MAVGTFHPAIEIWNLDVIDSLEPAATLGGLKDGPEGKKKKGKKGKKKAPVRGKQLAECILCPAPPPTHIPPSLSSLASRSLCPSPSSPHWLSARIICLACMQKQSLVPGSHAGAVLALAWNRTHRQLLASASDDATVKLWDVTTRSVVHTYTHHSEPVGVRLWARVSSFHPLGVDLLLPRGSMASGTQAPLVCLSASLSRPMLLSLCGPGECPGLALRGGQHPGHGVLRPNCPGPGRLQGDRPPTRWRKHTQPLPLLLSPSPLSYFHSQPSDRV